MEEWKIGEIREINGEWYQCVENWFGCKGCDFKNTFKCSYRETKCSFPVRQDHTSVIFKKLEKVGESYEFQKRTIQTYKLYTEPLISVDMDFIWAYVRGDNTIDIIIKQDMGENKTPLPKEDNPLTRVVYAYVNGKISDNELIKSIKEMSDEYPYNKNNIKPFSLEAAKAGKSVCTRSGKKARVICWNIKDKDNPIAAAVSVGKCESVYLYTNKGEYNKGKEDELDLMMSPEKKEGWVNVYDDTPIYDTKEEALNRRSKFRGHIDTVKVSWEE